jgi:hypothetical protein
MRSEQRMERGKPTKKHFQELLIRMKCSAGKARPSRHQSKAIQAEILLVFISTFGLQFLCYALFLWPAQSL